MAQIFCKKSQKEIRPKHTWREGRKEGRKDQRGRLFCALPIARREPRVRRPLSRRRRVGCSDAQSPTHGCVNNIGQMFRSGQNTKLPTSLTLSFITPLVKLLQHCCPKVCDSPIARVPCKEKALKQRRGSSEFGSSSRKVSILPQKESGEQRTIRKLEGASAATAT